MGWIIIDGQYPQLSGVPDFVPSITSSYSCHMWQMAGSSNGYPCQSAWPSFYNYCDVVHQNEYICVYDMSCSQDDFDSNGLAILMPISCVTTEELNGVYELELKHPIDEFGKWKAIRELNIIKADGQLFRIYRAVTTLNSDGSRDRVAYARHIFYDLSDKLLIDVRSENRNGQEFIDWIMNNVFQDDPKGDYPFYNYMYSSDIEETATSYFQNCSPVSALIGEDNCMINRLGGELYRDNFYFSINKHKEFTEDNAFDIRYGVDMLSVSEDIDYTDFCTYLRCTDNFGNMWAVSYVRLPLIHHNVSKALTFSYQECNIDQLIKDGQAYFSEHCLPKVSYSVTFANIKDDDRYKGFMDLQSCNVGDSGKIYCESLEIETDQKVVKKQKDILHQQTISIELGNIKSSLTRKDKYANMISSNSAADKATAALAEQLKQTQIKMITSHKSLNMFTHKELSLLTHKEMEGI